MCPKSMWKRLPTHSSGSTGKPEMISIALFISAIHAASHKPVLHQEVVDYSFEELTLTPINSKMYS